MDFNKKKSRELKGVAVLFMYWLHLYGHPELLRDDVWFTSLFLGKNTIIIDAILKLSCVCVPIFLFISGYAFALSARKHDFSIVKLLTKLYLKYWIVFILFIPTCAYLGMPIRLKEFLLNFFALTSSYCGEWWFFSTYIELSICFYLLGKTGILKKPIAIVVGSFVLLVAGYAVKFVFGVQSAFSNEVYLFLVKQPMYVCGYMCNEYNILDKLYDFMGRTRCYLFVFVWLFVFIPIPETISTVIIVPILVVIFCSIKLPQTARIFFLFLGENSMYLWLIHGLLIYKIAQKIIFYYHISIINFGVLLITTIPLAIICYKIEKVILKKVQY